MKVTTRKTHDLIELKVDEIETTIFKESYNNLQEHIDNLSDVLHEICDMAGKDVYIKVTDKD